MQYRQTEISLPEISAYMPPAYVCFLLPFLLISHLAFFFIQFFVKKKKEYVLIPLSILLIILPRTTRNYLAFHRFVPMTTNGWMNFYRGNNTIDVNSWGNPEFLDSVQSIHRGLPLEIAMSAEYKREALDYISNNPASFVKGTFRKISDLWIFNIQDTHFSMLINGSLSLFFFVFFIIGISSGIDWHRFAFESFYFIFSTFEAMLFFVLPRYQTMLHILMLPFCAAGIEKAACYLARKLL